VRGNRPNIPICIFCYSAYYIGAQSVICLVKYFEALAVETNHSAIGGCPDESTPILYDVSDQAIGQSVFHAVAQGKCAVFLSGSGVAVEEEGDKKEEKSEEFPHDSSYAPWQTIEGGKSKKFTAY
jgi:hypothetical protein